MTGTRVAHEVAHEAAKAIAVRERLNRELDSLETSLTEFRRALNTLPLDGAGPAPPATPKRHWWETWLKH